MRKNALFLKGALVSLTAAAVMMAFVACNDQAPAEGEKPDKKEMKTPDPLNLDDRGPIPYVVDVEKATLSNKNYRQSIWTGDYMQLVLMTLEPGEIIDLEVHRGHDQFIRVEKGKARVMMGLTEENLDFDKKVSDDWAVLIPAGYWHTIKNVGDSKLKLYTIYGPPEHPRGTINKTYEEAGIYHDEHHDHDHDHDHDH